MSNFDADLVCTECTHACLNNFSVAPEKLHNIESHKKDLVYYKGETVFKQESYISHVVFVRKGLIKVARANENGRSTLLKIVPSGQYLGIPVICGGEYHLATCTALKNSEICEIKRDVFKQVCLENPEMSQFLLHNYFNEFNYLYQKVSDVSTKNNHGKLAGALLYLCREDLLAEDVFQFITRRDIAELATISLESTNKLLNELKNDLIIRIEDGKIVVDRQDLLVHLARLG